ncbi:MAG: cysteine desulfurase [Eubacterium sp.]|jgi:cysteine desulfurase|nr:cysteine desulfurase [Eubacterium sp.]
MIYFDNAATTRPLKSAIDIFCQTADKNFGNASSLHGFGVCSEKIVEAARKKLIKRFGGEGYSLVFTSGGTESNNMAVFGVSKASKHGKKKIVSTAIEHESVFAPLNELEKSGYEVLRLSPCHDFERALVEAVDENTVMVSFMEVNNETGFVIDSEKVYREIKEKNNRCVVHVDACQAFLKKYIYGDLISVSGHKIHSPKGIGGLFIKKDIKLSPFFFGGGQQSGFRPGTVPSELIAAFGAAAEEYKYDVAYIERLKDCFVGRLSEFNGIKINSYHNIPDILNFSVLGIRSEVTLHFLAERGIYVSSGSACAGGKPSHVIRAFGHSGEIVDSAVRVSFCMDNTIDEIDEFFTAFRDILKRLRRSKWK